MGPRARIHRHEAQTSTSDEVAVESRIVGRRDEYHVAVRQQQVGDGVEESREAVHVEDVVPEGGTLVLLMSGEVEHLVRETRAERQCVVGWFRERCQVPEPDLAQTSLRTLRALDRKTTLTSCRGLATSGQRLWD